MWNLRSQSLKNWYLGQQLYLRVYDADPNPAKERPPPDNLLLCGKCFVRNIYLFSCFCDVFLFKINNVLFIYLLLVHRSLRSLSSSPSSTSVTSC
ncbi:hypothetical protein NC651_019518 [Populus alba x Populus x berolinensis]|nr:hypothetical protein NC651_019518 [Populus alba x Populus x berolinensis]